jgi:hypothetical protein
LEYWQRDTWVVAQPVLPSVLRVQLPVSVEELAAQLPPVQVRWTTSLVRVPVSSQLVAKPPQEDHVPKVVPASQDSPSVARMQLPVSVTDWGFPHVPLAAQVLRVTVRVRVPVVAHSLGKEQVLQGETLSVPHGAPTRLTVQDSVSVRGVAAQAPSGPHAKDVTVRLRVPCPLQSAPAVQGPHAEVTSAPQAVPVGRKPSAGQDREVPSHVSARSQPVAAAGRQAVAAASGVQVPGEDAAAHVPQPPRQSESQQRPSRQKPDWHSASRAQVRPRPFGSSHAPSAEQTKPCAHSASALHVVRHWPPAAQRNPPQRPSSASAGRAWQAPPAQVVQAVMQLASQHAPSTQALDWHWWPAVHGEPGASSGMQNPSSGEG